MHVRDDRVLTRHRSTDLLCPKSLSLQPGALQATFQEHVLASGLRWSYVGNGMPKYLYFQNLEAGLPKKKST